MKLNEEQITKRILHVCGGDPKIPIDYVTYPEYSPRMWR